MTTMTAPGTITQVYQLYIKASQEEVWKAITDPVTVARFFFGQVREASYEVGSSIRSWSPDRSQMWGDNLILECDPPAAWPTPGAASTTPTWPPSRRAGSPGNRGTAGRVRQAHPDPRPAGGLTQDRRQRARLVLHPQQPEDHHRDRRGPPAPCVGPEEARRSPR